MVLFGFSIGYLSTGDMVVPGNNGQKDQVMALKWLKQNARAFCGDPDQITIGGSSAGSISAGLHTMSPLSRGKLRFSGHFYFLICKL